MPELPLPLTIFVVTKNEENNLRRCLTSAADLASELVVVDSGSTDGTEAVAREFGAQWHFQEWLGFREQKKVALALCSQPWVLLLDSDEEISAELRPELIAFLESGDLDEFDGAEFPRRTEFLGRWITHGDWYPDRKLRLFRRDRGVIGGDPEHEVVKVPGAVKRMRGDLNHYSFPTMLSFISKIETFSNAFLENEIERGRRWSPIRTLTRPFWRFFRGYFLRRGFLDGFPGFWIAISVAYLSFIRYSRTYEHQKNEETAE
ncbi:MAG: glycosyltransferase involved in cell wall biosynthesis [Verrucomicrobiales bacterium]|jgi:glycosyltransferase involved in cell wall biosynthesis